MFASITMALMAATLVTAPQVASGDYVGKRVTIRGVVSAAVRDDLDDGFNWILLRTPDGTVCASSDKEVNPLSSLQPLLDAEIELTGTVQRFTHLRKFLGCQMLFDNPSKGDGIKVVKPAPSDPFSAKPLTDASYPHRQTAIGTVIAITGDSVFLRRAESILRVKLVSQDNIPPLGASIRVCGFAERNQLIPLLIESIWCAESSMPQPLEPAMEIEATALFKSDNEERARGSFHRYVNTSLCGKVIRIKGKVEATVTSGDKLSGVRLSCGNDLIFIDLSGFTHDSFPVPEVGSLISIAGLCYADFDASRDAIFPRFIGFSIIPRTAEDIKLLRAPAFWSATRLALALAITLLIIAALATWSIVLKIVSTRRGRELAKEQIRGARAELKVEERTRLAVELHDSISQTLTGVALQIDAASGADAAGSKVFLSTARNMLASCRQELNGCLWDLRSRTFEEKDMTEAVQRTLAPHIGSAKLIVRFNVPREKLSEQTAHAILRIIRELGVNAVKHGYAKTIRIAGEFHDDIISFSVTDDGRGFDKNTAPGPAQGHFGLQGVRERLNEFNGTIRCDSEPGCGAKFVVTLHASTDETE